MSYIHKEGLKPIGGVALGAGLLFLTAVIFAQPLPWLIALTGAAGLMATLWAVSFFRNPARTVRPDSRAVISPADGKVIMITETEEKEFYHDRRLRVSVFMSPFDVHVNRAPVSGTVQYYRYHSGKYFLAFHPKASELNERTSVVISGGGRSVLFRQIAGGMARRVICTLKEGQQVSQGEEVGIIKFGSRADIFLPLDFKLEVGVGSRVRGGLTVLGYFPTD